MQCGFFLGPTSEIDIRYQLSQSPEVSVDFLRGVDSPEQSVSLQTASLCHYSQCDWVGRETFFFFFLYPAGVLCTLLAGPLVPYPSAGRPSHSLILPVPRWLLVGAMWLSSNEPPGINRSSSPLEETAERELRENANRSFRSQGETLCLCGHQTNDKLFWLRRKMRCGDKNGCWQGFKIWLKRNNLGEGLQMNTRVPCLNSFTYLKRSWFSWVKTVLCVRSRLYLKFWHICVDGLMNGPSPWLLVVLGPKTFVWQTATKRN